MRNKLGERGDTLVEVVLALSILSLVVVSAFVAAENSFKLGQTAKERSQLVAAAELQADALKSFRDSHTWHELYYGNSAIMAPSCDRAPTTYCGVSSEGSSFGADCDTQTPGFDPCFHMELRAITESTGLVTEWVPVHGPYNGTAAAPLPGSGYVNLLTLDGYNASANAILDFTLMYGNTTIGQSVADATNSKDLISLRLANLESFRQ